MLSSLTRLTRAPFVQRCLLGLGCLHARWDRRGNPGGLFFIFKGYGIGGAEWVHKEIVQSVAEARPWVLFTHAQPGPGYLTEYRAAAGRVLDITSAYPHRWRRRMALGRIAGNINRHSAPTVFGSLSPFFYDLLPYLKPHVRRIDLTHSFDGFREFQQTPRAPLLDTRVVISNTCAGEMCQLYRRLGIGAEYDSRVLVIPNGIEVPAVCPDKPPAPPLRVLFVGRGSNAGGKRVFIIGRVAKLCAQRGIAATFTLVGPRVEGCVEPDCRDFVNCPGATADTSALTEHYSGSHVLFMPSEIEGFPVAIMEAMAHGVIPVVTKVGAIGEHVGPETGYLITDTDEGAIVQTAVAAIAELLANPARREMLSRQAFAHAQTHFGMAKFRAAYRKLLVGDEPQVPVPASL